MIASAGCRLTPAAKEHKDCITDINLLAKLCPCAIMNIEKNFCHPEARGGLKLHNCIWEQNE